jgi:protein-glutamine gamma-glutamyltransferase
MRSIEAIRNANRPGPPEHSIALRVACLGAVIVAIAATASMGEISGAAALWGIGLASLGMGVSYATRARPPAWIKLLVAVGAIAISVWFFHTVTGPVAGIANVEQPLVVLLLSILVLHSFHVPSRRDLTFSLAAAGGLMAVGGAQAINLDFGFYALGWAAFSLAGLALMWRSASGGGRMSVVLLASTLLAVGVAAVAIFLVLPAPTVAAKLGLFAKAGIGGSVASPGALAGDSGSPSQLARPGSPTGPTRVGGYLGFANSLNTALRGKLDNTLLMLVRAQRPSYWVGETFNSWNGESWTSTNNPSHTVRETSPFIVPPAIGSSALAQSDLQTFFVVNSTANLIFHAEAVNELWFPSSKIYVSNDGTIVSPIGLGKGTIYSVESQVAAATPAQLRGDSSEATLSSAVEKSYLQLPHPYTRAATLAKKITAGDHTTYGRVESLIAWMGTHTRYSLNIPPLPAGADTVNEFLFGNRVGFCEQISTSLAVMLRSLGIPTREVVGYVPGPYNPVTDLYQVRADDAHAWVQVWFPGLGWQSFDPTASVPLANPAPGATALHDFSSAVGRIPLVPVGAVVLGVGCVVVVFRRRHVRPRTWTEKIAACAEQAGRRAGHPRRPAQTLAEYADVLDGTWGDGSTAWRQLVVPVEASVYGSYEISPDEQRDMVVRARHLRGRRARSYRVLIPESASGASRDVS